MSLIKKCRPRITYDCCYVTRENIDEFLKIAEPEALEMGFEITKDGSACVIYYPFHSQYYVYGRYYIQNGYGGEWNPCYDFNGNFEIWK